jgi:hypothetical protein
MALPLFGYLQYIVRMGYPQKLVISDYDICFFAILIVLSMYLYLTSDQNPGEITPKSPHS